MARRIPAALRRALAELGADARLIGADGVDRLASDAGAYALVVRLARDVEVRRGRGRERLAAGWYVYAGSAFGPGGIRARLRRHFRRDKTPRWHVDQLTPAADFIAAVAVTGASECAVMAQLSAARGLVAAMPGFGSSDCAFCVSHLVRLGRAGVGRTRSVPDRAGNRP